MNQTVIDSYRIKILSNKYVNVSILNHTTGNIQTCGEERINYKTRLKGKFIQISWYYVIEKEI